eukprot:gnl/Dysnectes_brevis/4852_a6722_553.p1 GENE.gnl/Dysnectes_brevis/4852_a6722_553~~gnl/Dysnectes_brevis/4852_a6722_553.p1  ORF type:complete len:261 (+),score=28.59 gnl/Dysnectes_brevis/4852_a6722_553:34-783(+)
MEEESYVVGIDEAGRGPVLGPLVYGIAWCPVSMKDEKVLETMGIDDSKKLTDKMRESLLGKMDSLKSRGLQYHTEVISAADISAQMLAPTKISLNRISYLAARKLLQHVVDQGVKIRNVYIDLVSPASAYEACIRETLPHLPLIIEAKADANYAITGAASIAAKVTRDRLVHSNAALGSGYPGDPVTKKWIRKNIDPIFGFPHIVRTSWKTASVLLDERAVTVEWGEGPEKRPKGRFFADRMLGGVKKV